MRAATIEEPFQQERKPASFFLGRRMNSSGSYPGRTRVSKRNLEATSTKASWSASNSASRSSLRVRGGPSVRRTKYPAGPTATTKDSLSRKCVQRLVPDGSGTPGLLRFRCDTQPARYVPPLLGAHDEFFLRPQPVDPPPINVPTFSPHQHRQPSVAVAHMRRRQFPAAVRVQSVMDASTRQCRSASRRVTWVLDAIVEQPGCKCVCLGHLGKQR